jgi:hypothetical protein
MADDLATIGAALTERGGDLARYLIGEPTGASKRELLGVGTVPFPWS